MIAHGKQDRVVPFTEAKKLYSIFTKKQRTIYIGFTLILLSFALYIIQITS